jgi:hypothetical protein
MMITSDEPRPASLAGAAGDNGRVIDELIARMAALLEPLLAHFSPLIALLREHDVKRINLAELHALDSACRESQSPNYLGIVFRDLRPVTCGRGCV